MGVRNRFQGEDDKHTDEPKISSQAGIPLGAWRPGKSSSILVLKEMCRVRDPLKCHYISFLSEHDWPAIRGAAGRRHVKVTREILSHDSFEKNQDGKGFKSK